MIPFIKKTVTARKIFFLLADVILISFSVWLSFLLRFEGKIPSQYSEIIFKVTIFLIIFIVPIFYLQRLYHLSWAYVSINELVALFKGTTLSFIFLGLVLYISRYYSIFYTFPRSTVFISYFLILLFCGGFRAAKRVYLNIFRQGTKKEGERVLIVGAGDAGEQILRNILASKSNLYLPVGFVDDNPTMGGLVIHGLRVLGKINDIPKIVSERRIKELIIALPSAGVETIKRAVGAGRNAGLQKIKVVPSISEIINGQVSLKDLREVQVEDLLGRETVSLDTRTIENFIKGKIVLITGAAGSIGSELSKQIAKFKPSLLLLLDQDETGLFNISEELKYKVPHLKIISLIADICDEEKINQIWKEFRPNIVFHAAAYKHVPLMEEHPDEAVKNNVLGTEIVAKISLKSSVEKFVFISTDKAVNPTSVMGATKRLGEMICQTLNQKNHTKFISVRFGNVLNSRGSVIPLFKEQIRRGGPVEITHPEMKRYFMVTSEAVLLVMQAAAMGKGGEVFVLDMGKPKKIVDLAKEIIRLSGFEPDKDIPIVFTKPRPGEKFFEDILTAEEGTIATQNQKIFMAKLSEVDAIKLEEGLRKIKDLAAKNNRKEITEVLKSLIPSYKPKEEVQ